MARELELTWVAKLRQWRKRRKVGGATKTFYLGAGTSKRDQISYAKALAKWREIEKTLELAERGDKLRQQLETWRDELAARPGIDASVYFVPTESKVDQTKPLSASMKRWLDGTARMAENCPTRVITPKPNEKTMGQAVDEYIEAQREPAPHFNLLPQQAKEGGRRISRHPSPANPATIPFDASTT
jgi:hypothetical protein